MDIATLNAINAVESAHFRTTKDTGANLCAMLVWNTFRQEVGLAPLKKEDLPAWCEQCNVYHSHPCVPEIADPNL